MPAPIYEELVALAWLVAMGNTDMEDLIVIATRVLAGGKAITDDDD